MAENPEKNQEKHIPIFTVYKKGLIFKNIFLLDKIIPSPSLIEVSNPNLITSLENQNPKGDDSVEEILFVGRHPDCNIVLEHPSISRFHLRIHLHPSLQKLFIVDLGSAHGTWISDEKIEPHVPVELSEGDTLKLAASTRTYRLHWSPLSRAFDVYNPPVPPNFENLLPLEEEEEEGEGDEETLNSENLILFEKNPSPSAPPLPESMQLALYDDVQTQADSSFSFCTTEENYDANVVLRHTFALEPVNFSLSPVKSTVSESLEQQIDKENQDNSGSAMAEFVPSIEVKQESQLSGLRRESDTPSIWSRRGKPASLIRIQTASRKVENMDTGANVLLTSEVHAKNENERIPMVLCSATDEENVTVTTDKENYTPKTVLGSTSVKKSAIGELDLQSSISSLSSRRDGSNCVSPFSEKENNSMSPFAEKENLTPVVLPDSSLKKPLSGSRLRREADMIMSRRRAGREPFQTLVTNSISNSKSEVRSPLSNTTGKGSAKCDQEELTPKVLFPCSDGEEEVFTPGKENYTPTSELGSKSGQKGSRSKLEQQRSSGAAFSQREPRSGSRLRQESDIIMSNRRAGREPFQNLVVNSFSSSESNVSVPIIRTTSTNTITCDQKIETKAPLSSKQTCGKATRRWYMVADINSLLNKESRRSLQLLYGLQGTQLIIPRMVVRELESLTRQGSLFGSVSEASFALQWIAICSVETKNWIHVQDSTEEDIPPTPSASPTWSSQLSKGINRIFGKQVPSFSWTSLLPEIVTPTAQDCILRSALLFKSKKEDGQLVLLSNDVSLKIKAMAEGVICESAEEFRASLVDPYSERFLWAGSTPRGPTWSCLDEAAPREKFGYVPVKNGACKEANSAKKGLKLILRHNYSHYGQLASVR